MMTRRPSLIDQYVDERRKAVRRVESDEIEDFLHGHMAEDRRRAFLERLALQPDIARYVARQMPSSFDTTEARPDWESLKSKIENETGERLGDEPEARFSARHRNWQRQIRDLGDRLPVRTVCLAVGGIGVLSFSFWYVGPRINLRDLLSSRS